MWTTAIIFAGALVLVWNIGLARLRAAERRRAAEHRERLREIEATTLWLDLRANMRTPTDVLLPNDSGVQCHLELGGDSDE